MEDENDNLGSERNGLQRFDSSSESDNNEEEISKKSIPNRNLGIQARSLVLSGLPIIPNVSVSESSERYMSIVKRLTEQFISGMESIEPLPQLDNTLLLIFSSKYIARRALTLLNHLSWGDGEIEVNLASLALLDSSAKHQKKSKLLIRNLSFKCTPDELRKYFEKYGKVIDVNIPQKPGTNKMLGFAFVTMGNVFEASTALRKMNGNEIKDRKVAVDWALDRKTYLSQKQQLPEEPSPNIPDTDQQDESMSLSSEETTEIESISLDTESTTREDIESTNKQNTNTKPRRVDSTDGKCLFLRNLPFSLDEEDLGEFFTDRFGSVQYAKLVTNRDTGMLTGNGFVRFKEESFAEECLKQSEQGLAIEGRTIEVMRAVTKEEANVFTTSSKKGSKNKEDKRNLSMANIGRLDPESNVFQELSKADQVKRMRAEAEKKEKLKNPNIFVSKVRLSIRNLPLSMGDNDLKVLCTKYTPKGSKVYSAKVMRDLNRLEKGVGRSKGFGFVGFSSHEAAMSVLNTLNNDPNVLPSKRRLIVEFSLENQRAIKVKEDRLSKSKVQLQKLEKEGSTPHEGERKKRVNRFNKKGINKVTIGKKNKLQPSHKLKRSNKVNNEESKPKNNFKQTSKNSNMNEFRKRQIERPSRTSSRRDRKRKVEQETRDDRHFEELVRQYQKKLFKVN
ncbi:hypothetical protein LOD99_3248 [Oopsacas minuta]|uniref:RRM domain-containing protein n=1 Tax=Oopsacas minuta TaxID=111878 RepID=A0AAV7JXS8_9METZ|nr:hypothetical protein LOD99_3248 [Oopsacas minuta]